MKLSPRQDFQPTYKSQEKESSYKQAPPLDWSKFEIDWDKEVPYGRYKGYTLEELKDEDSYYLEWMRSNDLINQWALYKPKGHVGLKRKKLFYSETDQCYWKELMYFETGTDPAPEEWYQ